MVAARIDGPGWTVIGRVLIGAVPGGWCLVGWCGLGRDRIPVEGRPTATAGTDAVRSTRDGR
jgi:hypothetical protein